MDARLKELMVLEIKDLLILDLKDEDGVQAVIDALSEDIDGWEGEYPDDFDDLLRKETERIAAVAANAIRDA